MGANFPVMWAVTGPIIRTVRRGFQPLRLDTETRVSSLRALMPRRGCLASRLDAETQVSGLRALMLRRGCLASRLGVESQVRTFAPQCWLILTLRL